MTTTRKIEVEHDIGCGAGLLLLFMFWMTMQWVGTVLDRIWPAPVVEAPAPDAGEVGR